MASLENSYMQLQNHYISALTKTPSPHFLILYSCGHSGQFPVNSLNIPDVSERSCPQVYSPEPAFFHKNYRFFPSYFLCAKQFFFAV